MSAGGAYLARLTATLDGVIGHLRAKGIAERHLSFGSEGRAPARKPTVPTDARSEFLANRAMGDWAEKNLSAALGDLPKELGLSLPPLNPRKGVCLARGHLNGIWLIVKGEKSLVVPKLHRQEFCQQLNYGTTPFFIRRSRKRHKNLGSLTAIH